jgi:hypothetical protein
MAKNLSFFCFRAVFVSYCPLFWGSVEIYKAHDTQYILERNGEKTCHFCDYGYFPELLPTILGFWGDLKGQWHSVHVLEAWPKLIIFAFYGRFHELLPSYMEIYKEYDSLYILERNDKNSLFLHLWPFLWAIAHRVGGSGVIYKAHNILYMFERHDRKLIVFVFMAVFVTIGHSFWVPGWFTRPMPLSTFLEVWQKTRCFSILGPFSWDIAHKFGVLK